MKSVSPELLNEVVARLVKEFQPEKIILFGSHAWGVPHQDSDLDLFVIVPSSDMPFVKRSVRAHRCLRGLGVPKDVLVRTRDEVNRLSEVRASLENQVLRRGKVLYG